MIIITIGWSFDMKVQKASFKMFAFYLLLCINEEILTESLNNHLKPFLMLYQGMNKQYLQ